MLEALAAVTRALLYGVVLSGVGAVLAEASMRALLGESAHFVGRLMTRGAQLTVGATLAGSLILLLRLSGQFDEATLSAVIFSNSGAALCFQVAGSVLILATMGGDGTDRGMRLFDAALVLASFAICGHAASAGGLEAVAAFIHLSAAAWWVGSLWLLRHACAHLEPGAVAMLVRRFSSLALRLVGVLVVAGLVLLVALVDFTRQPLTTPYVRILAVKLGFVILLLGLAAYNRLRLTPRLLAGDQAAVQSLRQTVNGELVVIVAIIATTAVLTTYSSPQD